MNYQIGTRWRIAFARLPTTCGMLEATSFGRDARADVRRIEIALAM
jgi:hypothetical protein